MRRDAALFLGRPQVKAAPYFYGLSLYNYKTDTELVLGPCEDVSGSVCTCVLCAGRGPVNMMVCALETHEEAEESSRAGLWEVMSLGCDANRIISTLSSIWTGPSLTPRAILGTVGKQYKHLN